MSDKLDMSLDDIIAHEGIDTNGMKRKPLNNEEIENNGYNIKIKFDTNQVDDHRGKKRKFIETDETVIHPNGFTTHYDDSHGAIFASNLKYSVTDEDIESLFSAFGTLLRSGVNFLSDGRSAGTAFVVFAKKSDALNAHQSLNNVTLDGRFLRLALINCNGNKRSRNSNGRMESNQPNRACNSRDRKEWSDMTNSFESKSRSYDSDNNRKQRRNGYKDGNQTKSKFDISDLDADLDSYISHRQITK